MGAASFSIRFNINHSLLVKLFNSSKQLWVLLLNFVPVLIDLLELLGELGQALEEFLDHNDAEHEALTIAAESFNDEFQSDTLKDIVEKTILDDCSEKFGNLGEVDMRVLVQESVFVK